MRYIVLFYHTIYTDEPKAWIVLVGVKRLADTNNMG